MSNLFESAKIGPMTVAQPLRAIGHLGGHGDSGRGGHAAAGRHHRRTRQGRRGAHHQRPRLRPAGRTGRSLADGCPQGRAASPGCEQMAVAAHDHGAKMVLQMAHAGYFAAHKLTGTLPLAVSASVKLDDVPRRELTIADIRDVVQRLRRGGRPGQGRRVRRCADPLRPRLSFRPVSFAPLQQAHGRIRRHAAKPAQGAP